MEEIPNFEVVVGTYEEFLLGYKLCSSENSLKFTQSFATHSHSSSIRSLATCGKYLASGGADDCIIIYDMASRKEHSTLNHHNATINALEFTVGHSHLISGSADGVISIVRVGNWQMEKNWNKPNKNSSILSLAVHPTGKLALTLSSDCSLRTWNLIKGRQAYIINLLSKSADAKKLDLIKWNPDGENFILSGGSYVELWNITEGKLVNCFEYKSRVITVCWLNEKYVAIGHEDGKITLLNITNRKQKIFEAHTKRVKCLQSHENWLVSASSDGSIKIWFFNGKKLLKKGDCNTGCRCTCLALVALFNKESEDIKVASENSETDVAIKTESDSEISNDDSEDEQENEDKMEMEKEKQKTKRKNDKGCRVIVEEENPRKNASKKRIKKKNLNKKKAKKMKTT